MLKIPQLKFFEFQLMNKKDWSASKYQNLTLSAKFWYLDALQLDIFLKKKPDWQRCPIYYSKYMRSRGKRIYKKYNPATKKKKDFFHMVAGIFLNNATTDALFSPWLFWLFYLFDSFIFWLVYLSQFQKLVSFVIKCFHRFDFMFKWFSTTSSKNLCSRFSKYHI